MYRQVLKILNNKKIYTVEQLATKLSINVNELRAIIKDLVAYGIDLNFSAKDTCQLTESIELLDIDIIKSQINNSSIKLEIFDVIDSTNEYALNRAVIDKPLVCLAEYQTAGRGRQNHHWVSPYASGLCLSIKCNYTSKLDGLSIALAVTVARILYSLGITEIGLKWPNDILWQQRKLAGLLLESRWKKEVVIGIGINVKLSVVDEISQPWVDLDTILEQPPLRNTLAAYLIDNCLSTLLTFPNTGLKPFLNDWHFFDLSYGKLVTLYNNNKYIQGIATGINEQGALQIDNQSYVCGSLQFTNC
ncbi:biotin--[acetyl-CoA-carboxylase] ligase [Candidatus Halobeggiatoa sp. HSG11]|nr:biotin--[acetyl-CoA-carboxylase] ligase [Candidatus Halobeggiatoa sp. HSG11]